MSLSRKLHGAEERGAKAMHVGAKRLKTGIQDLSAGLRHLHVNRNAAKGKPVSTRPDPEQERETAIDNKGRTGIVSVNGCDVGEMRCTGGQRTSGR